MGKPKHKFSAGHKPAEPAINPTTNGLIEQQAGASPPAATNQPTTDETSAPQPAADRPGEGEGPVFIEGAVHPRLIGAEAATAPQPARSRMADQLADIDGPRYATPAVTGARSYSSKLRYELPPPYDVRNRGKK